MKLKFDATLSVAVAMSFGIIVLLGYFFGANPQGDPNWLGLLRDALLRGAVILSAVALLVGIANLSGVHLKKIRSKNGGGYSFVLLVSLIFTVGIGLWEISRTYTYGDLAFEKTNWIFYNIQLPIETSLMAVLAVSLIYAVARILNRRANFFSIVFIITVLFVFLGAIPGLLSYPIFGIARDFLVDTFAVGGARGILLGVALGTIATGLRILMGSDRPYGG